MSPAILRARFIYLQVFAAVKASKEQAANLLEGNVSHPIIFLVK